jgi:hypothetical protein
MGLATPSKSFGRGRPFFTAKQAFSDNAAASALIQFGHRPEDSQAEVDFDHRQG